MSGKQRLSTEERFLQYVNKDGNVYIDSDGVNWGKCWEWTASLEVGGYGEFNLFGKVQKAHRVSWFLKHNSFPEQCACHRCDNRKCVNPDHLFEGSRGDNARDMTKKKRHVSYTNPEIYLKFSGNNHWSKKNPELVRHGEESPNAKLKTEDVIRIKTLLRDGHSIAEVARKMGLRHDHIWDIAHNVTWGHVKI